MTKTNLKPLPGYLLVQPDQPEEVTASGIILQKKSEDESQTGTVLQVGGDFINDHGISRQSPVTTGDRILFKEWGKQKYKDGNKDYFLVKYEDVIALIK